MVLIAGHGAALGLGPATVNPWCGLCGAPAHGWRYEVHWSIEFPDWEAAVRTLRQHEDAQRATVALLSLIDATYDAHRPTGIDEDGRIRG